MRIGASESARLAGCNRSKSSGDRDASNRLRSRVMVRGGPRARRDSFLGMLAACSRLPSARGQRSPTGSGCRSGVDARGLKDRPYIEAPTVGRYADQVQEIQGKNGRLPATNTPLLTCSCGDLGIGKINPGGTEPYCPGSCCPQRRVGKKALAPPLGLLSRTCRFWRKKVLRGLERETGTVHELGTISTHRLGLFEACGRHLERGNASLDAAPRARMGPTGRASGAQPSIPACGIPRERMGVHLSRRERR